jgi:hypothetical protein
MNDTYEEGCAAYRKELPVEANPYKGQVEKEQKWNDGWEDAKIDSALKQRSICSDKLEPIE